MTRSPCYECLLKDSKEKSKEDLCARCNKRKAYYEFERDGIGAPFEVYQKKIRGKRKRRGRKAKRNTS